MKYDISVRVSQTRTLTEYSTVYETVEAESPEEAIARLKQLIEDEEVDLVFQHSDDDSGADVQPEWHTVDVHPSDEQ